MDYSSTASNRVIAGGDRSQSHDAGAAATPTPKKNALKKLESEGLFVPREEVKALYTLCRGGSPDGPRQEGASKKDEDIKSDDPSNEKDSDSKPRADADMEDQIRSTDCAPTFRVVPHSNTGPLTAEARAPSKRARCHQQLQQALRLRTTMENLATQTQNMSPEAIRTLLFEDHLKDIEELVDLTEAVRGGFTLKSYQTHADDIEKRRQEHKAREVFAMKTTLSAMHELHEERHPGLASAKDETKDNEVPANEAEGAKQSVKEPDPTDDKDDPKTPQAEKSTPKPAKPAKLTKPTKPTKPTKRARASEKKSADPTPMPSEPKVTTKKRKKRSTTTPTTSRISQEDLDDNGSPEDAGEEYKPSRAKGQGSSSSRPLSGKQSATSPTEKVQPESEESQGDQSTVTSGGINSVTGDHYFPVTQTTPDVSRTKKTVPSSSSGKRRSQKAVVARRCHHCKSKTPTFARCEFYNSNGAKCGKTYCKQCLESKYDVQEFSELQTEGWFCPSCLGYCLCAACKRERERNERRAETGRGARRIPG